MTHMLAIIFFAALWLWALSLKPVSRIPPIGDIPRDAEHWE